MTDDDVKAEQRAWLRRRAWSIRTIAARLGCTWTRARELYRGRSAITTRDLAVLGEEGIGLLRTMAERARRARQPPDSGGDLAE